MPSALEAKMEMIDAENYGCHRYGACLQFSLKRIVVRED